MAAVHPDNDLSTGKALACEPDELLSHEPFADCIVLGVLEDRPTEVHSPRHLGEVACARQQPKPELSLRDVPALSA